MSLQHGVKEIITHILLFDITVVKRSYDYIINGNNQTYHHSCIVLLPFAVHDFLVASERIPPKEKKNLVKGLNSISLFAYLLLSDSCGVYSLMDYHELSISMGTQRNLSILFFENTMERAFIHSGLLFFL